MASIKRVSKLEDRVAKELWKKGLRFKRNSKHLYGTPDISIKKYKIVIFIDSCFWHQCPIHKSIPKTNTDFWIKKLARNVERDKKVTDYYLSNNWKIMRIWEHELKEDFDNTVSKIEGFVKEEKSKYNLDAKKDER